MGRYPEGLLPGAYAPPRRADRNLEGRTLDHAAAPVLGRDFDVDLAPPSSTNVRMDATSNEIERDANLI